MRISWVIGLLAIALTGCTNHQLRVSTVNQASTLSDLQYQQVLDNLAMFAANPSAIPWALSLKNGSSQVADSGAATLSGVFGYAAGRVGNGTPGASGSRTIVEQWGTVPITDDTELRLLQIAYRRAFGFPDTLDDEGFANDLTHEVAKQVSVTDDYKVINDNLYKNPVTIEEAEKLSKELTDVGLPTRSNEVISASILATNDDPLILKSEPVSGKLGKTFSFSRPKARTVAVLLNLTDDEKKIAEKTVEKANEEDPFAFMTDPTVVERRPIPTAVVKEARRVVKKTAEDLDAITPLWFGVSCRKADVPKNACYVGHSRDRCGERYVWVCPERREELAKFTLTILSLSSLLQDRQIVSVPGGPAYAPASAYR